MKQQKLKRVYHPIDKWEEIKFNMWGEVKDYKESLRKAIKFTSKWKLYGYYMERVINEWKYSCENALTDEQLSKKAWLGHCAVALALHIPEDITRKAWGYLSDEQRILANKEATRVIATWERDYLENKKIYKNMEGQMLLF
jgi:hypothetical protein